MDALTQLPLDEQAVNTLAGALCALVVSLSTRMSERQRTAFADDLASLARDAEAHGDTQLETLLIDLHRAAR